MNSSNDSTERFAPKDEEKMTLQHKIDVENENLKFEHENTYKSCCLTFDKRALTFFTQACFSALIMGFCITMLIIDHGNHETFDAYLPLLTFIAGVWLKNPSMKKD